jgi:hypothetical protein
MKRFTTLRWLSLILVPIVGCAAKPAPQAKSAAVAEPKRYPVIVSLVGRHDVITITAGPKSPLYSAKTKVGVVLVCNATLDELRDGHPNVYRQVYPAITVQTDASSAVAVGYAGME